MDRLCMGRSASLQSSQVQHILTIPPYSFGHYAIVTTTRHVIPREQLELVRYLYSPPVLTEEEVRFSPAVRVITRPKTDNSEVEETGYRARGIIIVDVRADRCYWERCGAGSNTDTRFPKIEA